MLEYYKTYMNWETERWTKNVISHVGPQGLSVLMHDRGTFFKSSTAVAWNFLIKLNLLKFK